MQTDALFYQLFQTAPQIFFELAQIVPTCPYRFESVTFKAVEKRIDGLLQPTQIGEPLYFLEVQAFPDQRMYWRLLHEISLFFEQSSAESEPEWLAVVLWLDENDDPGFGTVPTHTPAGRERLRAIYLPEVLKQLPETSLALNVLRPFLVDNERQVRQNFSTWIQHIQQSKLSYRLEERLVEVLVRLIEQKFKTLNYEELATMLQLTPFEETRSFKKAHNKKLKESYIDLLMKLIKRKFRFADSTLSRLEQRLHHLKLVDLQEMFPEIIDMHTMRHIDIWIDQRLAPIDDEME